MTKEARISEFEKNHNCTSQTHIAQRYGQGWYKIKSSLKILKDGPYTFIDNNDIPKIEKYYNETKSNPRCHAVQGIQKMIDSFKESNNLVDLSEYVNKFGRAKVEEVLKTHNIEKIYKCNYFFIDKDKGEKAFSFLNNFKDNYISFKEVDKLCQSGAWREHILNDITYLNYQGAYYLLRSDIDKALTFTSSKHKYYEKYHDLVQFSKLRFKRAGDSLLPVCEKYKITISNKQYLKRADINALYQEIDDIREKEQLVKNKKYENLILFKDVINTCCSKIHGKYWKHLVDINFIILDNKKYISKEDFQKIQDVVSKYPDIDDYLSVAQLNSLKPGDSRITYKTNRRLELLNNKEHYSYIFDRIPNIRTYQLKHITLVHKDDVQAFFKIPYDMNDFETLLGCTNIKKLINKYGSGWWCALRCGDYFENDNIEIIEFKTCKYIKNSDIEKIKKYASENHNYSSNMEKSIVKYISTIYDGEILTTCRNIIKSDNNVPMELDIVIPEKHIAIEFNGDYWYSTFNGVSKNYHLNKTTKCQEAGLRLLHVFESMWISKQEICKSIIASALGVYKFKIYARKCIIKEISQKDCTKFLAENHIHGAINAKYRLGLFYDNELVQVIAIGKSRFKTNEYELYRMCTKVHTQVIGGFSKLLKHACKLFNIKEIYSYVDRSLYTASGYKKIGFELIGETTPAYHYVYEHTWFNRLAFQKHKLKDKLKFYDASLSEEENMMRNNYKKVYDCGNFKLKYISVY